jgi:hypothetical protein
MSAHALDELDARVAPATTDDERMAILDAAGRALRISYATREHIAV